MRDRRGTWPAALCKGLALAGGLLLLAACGLSGYPASPAQNSFRAVQATLQAADGHSPAATRAPATPAATAAAHLQAARAASERGDYAGALAAARQAQLVWPGPTAEALLAELGPTATAAAGTAVVATATARALRQPTATPTPTLAERLGDDAEGYGLIGQTWDFCGPRRVPFRLVVEAVQADPWSDGGLRIVVVARATNLGQQSTSTALESLRIEDERGRRYDRVLGPAAGDLHALGQVYGTRDPNQVLQPGLSARHLWAFVVAPDVQRLTLVPSPRSRCAR